MTDHRTYIFSPGRGLAAVQLALNALWSWLFFGWHRGALAFSDVLLLDGKSVIVAQAVIWPTVQSSLAG